ncbi:hypothetical protein RQM65_08160 [Pricia sp. S334]|uniref:Uncharacterized protein n=1 Tax=Pricia mediterranea TaxID=3076079 RepID=A0ABU3L4G4_9FLAO|nr:hypothetical protein [Pricia sp. S334]MDT7828635.1 hypothetical protein [Pricia sp. S334]
MKKPLIVLFSTLFLLNCSTDDGIAPTPPDTDPDTEEPEPEPEPEPEANAVRLRDDGTFGNMLTDSEGMSLYYFSPDAKGNSNCTDGCLDNWPVFYQADLTLDEGLDADNFGSITRNDGDMQTTYKGWPLYYYANDSAEGDVTGDGVGSVWFVAKPDYSVMMARAQLVGRDPDGVETNLTEEYEPGDGDTFYMTDAFGNTLYAFINDTNGVNNYTDEDFSNNALWPIFEEELEAVPSVLDAADFGSIDVFGRQQLTFKGWPLYHFGQDESRGDNYGVGFPAPGIWPIVNPNTETAPEPESENVVYSITNDGAVSYIFNGNGLTDAVNPDFTLTRGQTYEFDVNAPGHPFLIKSVQSTGTDETYEDGVDDNGATDGKVTFTVPMDAPDTLYYACEFHSPMTGTLNIVD